MIALGEEVSAEIAGKRLEMARDGFVKTVMNDTCLTCLHVRVPSVPT